MPRRFMQVSIMPLRNKQRVKPSAYPPLPFHVIHGIQLVSAVIVGGISAYFLHELHHDHYTLPWTFILLLVTAIVSGVTVAAKGILHCMFGLQPSLSMSLNGILLVLWTISFGLLSWWTSRTLGHVCTRANWETSVGLAICRAYKALFSFALFSVVAAALALGLDFFVRRETSRRGRFVCLQTVDQETIQDGRGLESNPHLLPKKGGIRAEAGYQVPDEQFAYHEGDISYRGAHP